MDFDLTGEEEALRQEVRAFLKQEMPSDWLGKVISPYPIEAAFSDDEIWSFCTKMSRKLGERGWLTLNWPREYGGRASPVMQLIVCEELFHHEVPARDPFGPAFLAPVLMRYGTQEQKRRHLGPIARGEISWCIGFSEPSGGSDLAYTQTRAEESGDGFVINGQKLYTTNGHRADWCYLLAKTDQEAPRGRGISFFIVDLKTPGITVRPLLNMAGQHCFNEVFFDNVKVPRENLVGEENRGLRVAMASLDFERAAIDPVAGAAHFHKLLVQYVKRLREEGGTPQNLLWRQKLAEMAIEIEVGRLLTYRVAWMQSQGLNAESESSMSRLFGALLMQRISEVGMELLGHYGELKAGSRWTPLAGMVEHWYLVSRGKTIGAGTSEIQRNAIATRGLGLPKG